MIIVRDVFQIDPDHMREAREVARELRELGWRIGSPISRILTDLTGEYYTLVFEGEFESLAEYEGVLQRIFSNGEWQTLYPRLRRLLRGGRREIFTVID